MQSSSSPFVVIPFPAVTEPDPALLAQRELAELQRLVPTLQPYQRAILLVWARRFHERNALPLLGSPE